MVTDRQITQPQGPGAQRASGDQPAGGIVLGIAFGTLLIVAGVGPAVVALPVWAWLLVVTAVTAVSSWWMLLRTAVLTAGMAWLMLDGFVVDRLGELSWHGRADLGRLLLLAAAAMVPQAVRAIRGPR